MRAFGTLFSLSLLFFPAGLLAAQSASAEYEAARPLYFELMKDGEKQKFRHHWTRVINSFSRVAKRNPKHEVAIKAWYTVAELYNDLSKISYNNGDRRSALSAYQKVIMLGPKHVLADDSVFERALIYQRVGREQEMKQEIERLLADHRHGDMAERAELWARQLHLESSENQTLDADTMVVSPKKSPRPKKNAEKTLADNVESKLASLQTVTVWPGEKYPRLALYFDQERSAKLRLNKSRKQLTLTLAKVKVAKDLQLPELSEDGFWRGCSVEEKGEDTLVECESREAMRYSLQTMRSPPRLVVDFSPEENTPSQKVSTVRPLVILDPGHGGKDGGASAGKLKEKDIVLKLAKKTKVQLEKLGFDVALTRDDDRYLALEARTAVANRRDAVAFVSLHVNSNTSSKVGGIETYYLRTDDQRFSKRLKAREKKAKGQVTDVSLVLADLAAKSSESASKELAQAVQQRLVKAARKKHPKVRDLGVKSALFYVLLGARMPAILVESSFISHEKERKLLKQDAYLEDLAKAVASGVSAMEKVDWIAQSTPSH